MAFDRDLVRSVAEPILLHVVSKRPMYGYEIIKVVNEKTDGAFVWKEGTLYPCLHRLEGDRLIKSQWQKAESGRSRKYYSITPKGTVRLKGKLKEWSGFTAAVEAVLMAPVGV